MARNGTKWTPTPKQRKVVEILINPEERRSKSKILAECGVPRRTFYNWMRDPDFLSYLNSELEAFANTILPDAWKSLARNVQRGDPGSIKLYFEMIGKYKQAVSNEISGALEVVMSDEAEQYAE